MAAVKKPTGEKATTEAQVRAAWEAQLTKQAEPRTAALVRRAPDPWPEGAHTFVQFGGAVVVLDSRGGQQLADRAVLGDPFGPYGLPVMSIVLDGDWFEISTVGPAPVVETARTYRVPLTNVRSARR
jgi:hypothetical protein